MKILTLFFLSINLSLGMFAQMVTVTTTNVYSIRFIDTVQYPNSVVICNFGEVINVDKNFQGVDIGAYQTPDKFMENRTIMTFDLRSIPLTVSNKPISKVTLTVPLQNQDNGIPNGIIDIYSFFNISQPSTNLWTTGTYYTSFPNSPDLQNVDVTSLVKSAKNAGYTNLNLKMSTSNTNSSCVFVSPTWHTNKTSLVVNYAPVVIPERPTDIRFVSF